jgi:hypothetical protein
LIILLAEGRRSHQGPRLISVHHPDTATALGDLSAFRHEFYTCLTRRADALFELSDAALCCDGPVRSLVETCLAGEHRRGHSSLYAALNHGRIEIDRLRRALTGQPLPRAEDGRLVLAVDITSWLRPEAHTSPDRILCHTYGRGKDTHIMIPGWPYSVICALEVGRHSWTAPLHAQRLAPGDDAATVTATQLRQVVTDLTAAGQWQPGDPDILIVADAGYDGPRLAFLLSDLPVAVLVRMRSDRVLRRPTPARAPGTMGRPRRHGGEFVFGDPTTWGDPDITTHTYTRLYGPAHVRAWDRLHPRLTHCTAWPPTSGNSRFWTAPSCVWRSSGYRPARSRNRCGCGTPTPASPWPMWTGYGRRSCVGSISSTPSGCSNRPWAGPRRSCALRRRRIGGPG